MPPDAWRNVSAEQIVNVAGKAFTAFTPAQVIAMNKNAFRSITNIQSANFQTETLLSISTEKFKEVSPLFTNGLSAAQWLSLIEFRTNVTTIFDISQMSSPNLEVASNVADFYDSGRLPISGTFPLDPSQLTWLEVASLHAPKPENIPTVIMAIHQAVAGFRRMVISSMTPEDMATFVPPQGRYFTAGILSTITEIQFGNIGQDVVKEFTEHAWPGLNASLIPMLSRGVVESFSNDVIMTLTCSQLGNFTAQQYSWLPDTKRPLFEAVRLPVILLRVHLPRRIASNILIVNILSHLIFFPNYCCRCMNGALEFNFLLPHRIPHQRHQPQQIQRIAIQGSLLALR
jgi:hypothetical protein